MDDKWKTGLLQNNLSLWKMLTEALKGSKSEEKNEYYVEYANSVHPDFSVIMLSCSFALAQCYAIISTIKLAANEGSAAALNLNLCEKYFKRYLQAKEFLKNESIPLDLAISKDDHEGIESGLIERRKRI
jgi:hypothetical protein